VLARLPASRLRGFSASTTPLTTPPQPPQLLISNITQTFIQANGEIPAYQTSRSQPVATLPTPVAIAQPRCVRLPPQQLVKHGHLVVTHVRRKLVCSRLFIYTCAPYSPNSQIVKAVSAQPCPFSPPFSSHRAYLFARWHQWCQFGRAWLVIRLDAS
jgi:hypothetical protein